MASDRTLHVLHVLEAVGGGTTRHLVDLVRHANGVRHSVVLPPPGHRSNSGADYDLTSVSDLSRAGARLYVVDMRRMVPHPVNAIAPVRLAALLRREGVDVVHGHSSVGGALARLGAAGARVPAVYSPHGIATGRAARATERLLGPLTARLVAVSESEAADARRSHLARPERVVVIPNGIGLEPLAGPAEPLRSLLGLSPGTPLVGTVARLVAQKAPEQFVRVCREIARHDPDPHFVLIGMGPLQGLLDREVSRAGLGDRWHQLTFVPDVADLLGELDVFVLTSRFEGGPYTPLEAMRAGTPVVLTDVRGNCDTVDHGVSGWLVPFGDTASMAARVLDALGDPSLRDRVVAAAADRLRTDFDVRVMGARLAELYRQVTAESARRSPHSYLCDV